MSKILIALMSGEATEVAATVGGVRVFVVMYKGRNYILNRGRFVPVASDKIKVILDDRDAVP